MRTYEVYDSTHLIDTVFARNPRAARNKVARQYHISTNELTRTIDITDDAETLPTCGACGWTGEAHEYALSRCPNCGCPV